MTNQQITLEQIERLARDESAKMSHFYVGVEHLFMALTRLEGGLTRDVFDQLGLSDTYLRFQIRNHTGRGDERRYWTGYPRTPRAAGVLERAEVLQSIGITPAERALMVAILEEGQNVPVRVLRSAYIDLGPLRHAIEEWSGEIRVRLPPPRLDRAEALSGEQKAVVEQMFRNYTSVEILQLFNEGFSHYSDATVMLARPFHADQRADALVVVKLYDRQAILWEKKRYDEGVRDRLPPQSSRIDAEPTIPDGSSMGGLKYTFIRRDTDTAVPINLGQFALTEPPQRVARFLREGLYDSFKETWWGQNNAFNFVLGNEYDLVLPPQLIIEALPGESAIKQVTRTLRPLGDWTRTGRLRPGETVMLEEFVALRIRREQGLLQLVSGNGAEAVNFSGRVHVRNMDFEKKAHYRGEVVPRLVGRVLYTRDDLLQMQVQGLEPDFNILDDLLPYRNAIGRELPNPLRHYAELLDERCAGSFSTIHGDLHTGNILVGPSGDAWLIDFEWARDGHTLFDWAVLEVSLIIDYLVPLLMQNDWADLWPVVAMLDDLNRRGEANTRTPLGAAMQPIAEIRRIVAELLASRRQGKPDNWAEYFGPLALCALRVISWDKRPLATRRLAFLVSALAVEAQQNARRFTSDSGSTDLTRDQTTDQNLNSVTPR